MNFLISFSRNDAPLLIEDFHSWFSIAFYICFFFFLLLSTSLHLSLALSLSLIQYSQGWSSPLTFHNILSIWKKVICRLRKKLVQTVNFITINKINFSMLKIEHWFDLFGIKFYVKSNNFALREFFDKFS